MRKRVILLKRSQYMLQKPEPESGEGLKYVSSLDIKSRNPEGEKERVYFSNAHLPWVFCRTAVVSRGGKLVSWQGQTTRGQSEPW